MTYLIIYIILGFILLITGANWLVNGASLLAKRFHVSDLVIGLTIVAFGTSTPELIVNVIASIRGYNDIVLGNIIGSNNFNVFVILGVAGLIYPIKVKSSTAWKEIPISIFAGFMLFLMAHDFFIGQGGVISRFDGLLLFACFLGFLYYIFYQMKEEKPIEEVIHEDTPPLKLAGLILFGLAGLLIGGQLVVKNSVSVATEIGVSEKIIGLTIVAAGTSLPELVTSVVAAIKQKSDIAIGNVVGSNIFNVFLILAISSMISPIEYSSDFDIDVYLLMGGTALLIVGMVTGVKKQLDRWEAAIILMIFIVYTSFLIGK